MIFKWNETDIRVSEVLKLTAEKPVFGHISGKRSNTHWICFMKQNMKTKKDSQASEKPRNCGNCALCIHTYMGSECSLTDNAVDDVQDGCIDYIPED